MSKRTLQLILVGCLFSSAAWAAKLLPMRRQWVRLWRRPSFADGLAKYIAERRWYGRTEINETSDFGY